MSVKHWGEIPPMAKEELEFSGIAKIEREQIVKIRQVDVVGAKLYNPCYTVSETPIFEDTIPCKRTLHTIQLLKCHKQLEICYQDLNDEKSGKGGNKNLPVIPSIPDASDIPLIKIRVIPKSFPESLSLNLFKNTSECNDSSQIIVNQDYFERSDFAQGIGEAPLSISGSVAWKILKKAIATICAHVGFDAATDLVLDTLTDAAQHYLMQLCQSLRYNAFHKLYPEPTLFPDALECTLQEIGIGDMITLDIFYKSRVIQYHETMMKNCANLRHQCEMLQDAIIRKTEKPYSESESKENKIQFQVMEDNQESHSQFLHIPIQIEEPEKALLIDPKMNTLHKEKESMSLFEFRTSTPDLDATKEMTVQEALQLTANGMDISQSVPNVSLSASNSPSSSSDNNRLVKPLHKKKKI